MQMHYFFAKTGSRREGVAMAATAQESSRLTARYQTTVPREVRKRLNLQKGDRIRYCTEPNGRVYIEAARDESGGDPALAAFLDFLEADIQAHPERLKALDGVLRDRIAALVEGVEVDMDAALSPEDS
jgi:antitoxin PrlF